VSTSIRRLLASLEAERRELASELHGAIGGTLTAVALDLAILERQVGASSPATRARLAAARTALADALEVKRTLVDALRPALLDHLGLSAALQALCERHDVACECGPALDTLTADDAVLLYRLMDALLQAGARPRRVRAPTPETPCVRIDGDGAAPLAPEGAAMAWLAALDAQLVLDDGWCVELAVTAGAASLDQAVP
jgi:hypothetical protein